MPNTVPLWATILLTLASGLFGLLGGLGAQLISAHATLKLKKLEILYGRKADAYRDLLIKAGIFAHDPVNDEKYLAYLSAYHTALIVASEDVEEALNGKVGVSVNAQRLRTTRNNVDEMVRIQSGQWYDAMKAATKAIQTDLQHLAKH
jgi:hypothetical protein